MRGNHRSTKAFRVPKILAQVQRRCGNSLAQSISSASAAPAPPVQSFCLSFDLFLTLIYALTSSFSLYLSHPTPNLPFFPKQNFLGTLWTLQISYHSECKVGIHTDELIRKAMLRSRHLQHLFSNCCVLGIVMMPSPALLHANIKSFRVIIMWSIAEHLKTAGLQDNKSLVHERTKYFDQNSPFYNLSSEWYTTLLTFVSQ